MANKKPLDALGALKEATKAFHENLLVILSTTLLGLVPYDLLCTLSDLHVPPLLVMDHWPSHLSVPEIPKQRIHIEPSKYILSGICTITMACMARMACTGDKLTSKELLFKAHRLWRPMITMLCVNLFYYMAIELLLLLSFRVSGLNLFLITLVVIVMPVLITCGSMAWRWGIMASVMEDECYGMKALGRVWQLIKGRKLRVLVFMVATVPLELVISKVCSLKDGWEEMTVATGALRLFVVTSLCLLGRIYEWILYAVFYHNNIHK